MENSPGKFNVTYPVTASSILTLSLDYVATFVKTITCQRIWMLVSSLWLFLSICQGGQNSIKFSSWFVQGQSPIFGRLRLQDSTIFISDHQSLFFSKIFWKIIKISDEREKMFPLCLGYYSNSKQRHNKPIHELPGYHADSETNDK